MTNATMEKFGYPASLIREYQHWCVLLRPAQPSLGALVLACRQDAEAFSKITPEAFSELALVTEGIEASLKAFRPFEKINYLMLMMVDNHVHFHVLPRYSTSQSFEDIIIEDTGWPALPEFAGALQLNDRQSSTLRDHLKSLWVN